MGVNSCGPFMEVVNFQNFPKYGKDTILLFQFCEKLIKIGQGPICRGSRYGRFNVYEFKRTKL